MTCFNKQNIIYFRLTSTRSIVKPIPGSGHLFTLVYPSEKKYIILHLHSNRGSLAFSNSEHTGLLLRRVLSI